jgi:hypothetical protein
MAGSKSMTETDYARTLDELDRLLNGPDVPMQPSLIWRLLDRNRGKMRRAVPRCPGSSAPSPRCRRHSKSSPAAADRTVEPNVTPAKWGLIRSACELH